MLEGVLHAPLYWHILLWDYIKRKLCLSTKFPHQEIRWNYFILCSVYVRRISSKKIIFLSYFYICDSSKARNSHKIHECHSCVLIFKTTATKYEKLLEFFYELVFLSFFAHRYSRSKNGKSNPFLRKLPMNPSFVLWKCRVLKILVSNICLCTDSHGDANYDCWNTNWHFNWHSLLRVLRILTGKKHPKIKLQCLRKIWLRTFGSLIHQINSF